MIWILTREGKSYSDEGLLTVKKDIQETYNDNSNFIINMGAYLNEPENLASTLERNDGSGYLIMSMQDGGVYFTGEKSLHAAAQLIREKSDMNPWLVMAYIVKHLYPGEFDDEGIPESLD